jgi:DnaJ family protein C protein 17
MTDAERREQEIQRLAEDGKRRRKEQQEKLERQRREAEAMEQAQEAEAKKPARAEETPEINRTVKVRFSREGETVFWDKEKISAMFSKYGKIDSVVMGKDKKIRASGEKHRKVTATVFIVYVRLHHAHAAVMDAKTDYPSLESVAWAGKEPEIVSPLNGEFSAPSTPLKTPNTPNKSFSTSFSASIGSRFGGGSAPGTPSFSFSPKTPNLEDITMMRLKQAEKKRLEEQIRKQEAAEEAAAGGDKS